MMEEAYCLHQQHSSKKKILELNSNTDSGHQLQNIEGLIYVEQVRCQHLPSLLLILLASKAPYFLSAQ